MDCRMMMRVLVLTLAFGLIAGCGESEGPKVKTVAVSGTVSLDGSPLAGCSVSFNHSPEHVGIGQTDANGKYELQAEPGENRVLFGMASDEEEEPTADEANADEDEGGAEAGEGDVIPAKYRDPENPVKFDVPEEGTTSADFKLESGGGGGAAKAKAPAE